MITVHVLKMSCCVKVELRLDEDTGQFVCEWDADPALLSKNIRRIAAEYLPWRDTIVYAWSQRTGKRIVVITPGADAKMGAFRRFGMED